MLKSLEVILVGFVFTLLMQAFGLQHNQLLQLNSSMTAVCMYLLLKKENEV